MYVNNRFIKDDLELKYLFKLIESNAPNILNHVYGDIDGKNSLVLEGGLSKAEIEELVNSLNNNTTLETLKLHYSNVVTEHSECIADFIKHNKSLTEISFAFSILDYTGVKNILESLSNNNTLKYINFGASSLPKDCNEEIIAVLKNTLKQNKTLKRIDLNVSGSKINLNEIIAESKVYHEKLSMLEYVLNGTSEENNNLITSYFKSKSIQKSTESTENAVKDEPKTALKNSF